MRTMSLRKLVVIVLFVLPIPVATGADSQFGRLVIFGDSLSDPGNAFVLTQTVSVRPYDLIPSAPYARGGLHFSNGETWVEQLAKDIHLSNSAGPAFRVPGVFSNYAVGAARARPGALFDLSSQVVRFLGDFAGAAPTDGLYILLIGGNDLRDALVALAIDPSGITSAAIIAQAVNAIAVNITVLSSAGATQFLVGNLPDLAVVPAVQLQGPLVQLAAHALSIAFNQALATALNALEIALPVTITRLDVFSIVSNIVSSPGSVGLTEVQAPCITPGVTAHATCARPDKFLFWDGIHPTKAVHSIFAQEAGALLGP